MKYPRSKRFVLLLAPLVLWSGASAQLPASEEGVPEVVSEELLPDRKPDTEYRNTLDADAALQALESRFGTFDPQLGQGLTSLAMQYQQNNQHAEAAALLRRAWNITRINKGLHSPGQRDLLNLLIDSQEASRDWPALNQSYHYLAWLALRNRSAQGNTIVNDLFRVGKWHLRGFYLETGEPPGYHLVKAADALDLAVQIIREQDGETSPRLIEPLQGLALMHLRVASFARSADSYEDLRMAIEPNRSAQDEQLERAEAVRSSFRSGRDALQEVVRVYEANPQLGEAGAAIAKVYLADWHLVFNRRNTAREMYVQAWLMMKERGIDETIIKGVLGSPQILPALRFSEDLSAAPQIEVVKRETVKLAFDVTRGGVVRNIQVLEVEGEDADDLQRSAKRQLARARFRPRVENGQIVATSGVKLRYVFQD